MYILMHAYLRKYYIIKALHYLYPLYSTSERGQKY